MIFDAPSLITFFVMLLAKKAVRTFGRKIGGTTSGQFLCSINCTTIRTSIELNYATDLSSTIPTVKLNNGFEMPVIGLGTWQSSPGELEAAIKDAIDVGYRHIDAAFIYENEKEVGQAIADKIKDGTVARKDLFVTSKLWNTFHDPKLVEKACKRSLSDLGLEYLDLYLIHWPFGYAESKELVPKDSNGQVIFSDFDYVDVWVEMEKLVNKGLVKSIGVSNFNHEQIERILAMCKIKPVNNQVECHAYLAQKELGEWLTRKGITMTAFSPLGSPAHPNVKKIQKVLMKDPVVKSIADKRGKSPAQILIRYVIQRGFIVIPKSVKKERLLQNKDVFDFSLSDEEMKSLLDLDCNTRYTAMKGLGDTHKYYGFHAKF